MIGACKEEREEFADQTTRWLHEVTAGAGLSVSRADEMGFFKATTRNHLTEGPSAMSGVMVRPIYAGIVRASQRETSELERLTAELEKEWELPNVDFKREQSVDPDEQKSEFVKDMIALATTQLPGDRYYMIGGMRRQGNSCHLGLTLVLPRSKCSRSLVATAIRHPTSGTGQCHGEADSPASGKSSATHGMCHIASVGQSVGFLPARPSYVTGSDRSTTPAEVDALRS